MVRIEILSGPAVGKVVELGPGRHVVGRHASADLAISDDTVSGKHAELEVSAADEVRFRDLGSTNGTWSGGVKVEQGEWFPGSELRFGSVKLRLQDPASAAESAGEDEVHRRAVAEAMSGGRRGGPWLLLLMAGLLGAAGGAFWYFSGDKQSTDPVTGDARTAAAPAGAPRDLLEGYGEFASDAAEAWRLPSGAELGDGLLRNAGGAARVVLAPRLPLDGCAVELSATLEGVSVWPLLELGREGAERPHASWAGSDLADGPARLRLPCAGSDWFQLHLLVQGSGMLRDLRAVAVDGQAQSFAPEPTRSAMRDAANLLLLHRDGTPLLSVAGVGGEWQETAGGLRFEPTPGAGAWLELTAGPATLDSGPSLLFSDGGPVGAAAGVVVDSCPGILFGGEARRLWMPLQPELRATCRSGRIRIEPGSALDLRWDLATPLAEGARVARSIDRASRENDDATLLAACATLLRSYPFDEEQVVRALQLRRAAIARGRGELSQLQGLMAEAVFLSSAEAMREVEDQARRLALRLPGTDVAREADDIASLLDSNIRQAEEEQQAARDEYRARLAVALQRSYPVLAGWVSREGGS